MNKAVPWNVNGVGFDAREAAREAARRQGKSLGEWLHSVISDHAANLGVEEHEVAGQQRIDAITSKLERMSVRSADHDRRQRAGRPSELPRRRPGRDRDDDYEPRDYRRPRERGIEETEFLLEEAIDAMERRAARAERRTDDALDSFAKLLERNEANRERERDSVNRLAQKLTDIETRLSERGHSDENPIKGALARLESRLESIGKRSSLESAARLRAMGGASAGSDDVKRLEEKLNSILEAVQNGSGASSIALAASQDNRPKRDRRLGDAIAEIARRQEALDGTRGAMAMPMPPGLDRREAPERRQASADSRTFLAMQNEIAALATTIESLRHEVADQRQQAPQSAGELDALRAEIVAMSGTLREITASGSISPRLGDAPPLAEMVDHRLEIRDLIAPITPQAESRAVEPAESAHLESLVRELGERLEAAQAPGAGSQAIDALQQQVSILADRFARSDDGLDKLTSLERSMHDLFAHLEEARTSVEMTAARAAREALRIAMEEGRAQNDLGAASSIATLHDLQKEADARTASTLTAVHETLEKVVARLAAVETDIADQRRPPPASVAPTRKDPTFAPLGIADSVLARPPGEAATRTATRPAAPKIAPPKLPQAAEFDLDGAGRADFIAAARRAAKVAQSDPAVAELKKPGQGKTDSTVRAGLAEQTRDYVAQHKRPVLLSIAALFVVLGTMAVIQRIGLDDSGSQSADAAAPARISRVTDATPAPSTRSAPRPDDQLSPSALPQTSPTMAKPIPGSDPIQTGSISSNLPSFAAATGGSAPRPPQPTLPAHLVSLAQSGDGAAEYALGSQYAEGTAVPRDFAQAAKWYQKAAAQNLAPAQYRLASLYEKGLGVTKDKIKAKALYQQAAEAGNPRAMHNLAVLLADGDGKPDYEGAATWFRKAAQYGVHDSQYNLAILLARGIGVQQSFVQSYQWFAIAAAQGDSDAAKKREEVGTRLSSTDMAVAKALAASFRPRTADVAATEVQPPPGGWDGASAPSRLNSAGPKVSSL